MRARSIAAVVVALVTTLGGCGSCGGSSQPAFERDGGAVFLQESDSGHRHRLRRPTDPFLKVESDAGPPP